MMELRLRGTHYIQTLVVMLFGCLSLQFMCNDCFTSEINFFSDERTWLTFDFELTKKLSQLRMKFVMSVHDKHIPMGGHTIYECLTCGEKWKLNDPDNAFRGYFLKLSTAEPK
jgi:hypothetical protein